MRKSKLLCFHFLMFLSYGAGISAHLTGHTLIRNILLGAGGAVCVILGSACVISIGYMRRRSTAQKHNHARDLSMVGHAVVCHLS
jgi:hypothetical protein